MKQKIYLEYLISPCVSFISPNQQFQSIDRVSNKIEIQIFFSNISKQKSIFNCCRSD